MAYYIQGILIVFVEAVCCILFFGVFSERRYTKRPVVLLLNCLTVLAIILSVFLLDDHLIAKVFVIVPLVSVLMAVSMKLKLWKAAAISLLFFGALGAIDIIFYLLMSSVRDLLVTMDPDITINASLFTALSKLVDFWVVIWLRKHLSKSAAEKNITDSEWIRFMVFPIFTLTLIIAMMGDSGAVKDPDLERIYMLFSIGLVVINLAAFYLLCDIVKRERRIHEDDLFRERVKNQAEMYKSVYDNYELQRKRAHEYKNQIMCMEALLQKKEYGELEKYITEIGGKLTDTDSNINTNNTLIDAIVNTKYREMEERGILLVMKFNEMADLWVEDSDIVVILSNLLNNAIEACEKCDQKTIKLKLMKEADEIIISVRNTYNGEIVKEGEEIRTLKADKEEHGLGIKNIIESVEKYGGSYSINYDDKEFVFSICIPKP
ncbi:MAG: GHKL domain-containing protein [Lachnospiraceae bacterium]|nr:GHKL domain-containing protein [Lachnospiraceae bacterium]